MRNLLELGELRMVAGEPAESAWLAGRVLAIELCEPEGTGLPSPPR